jgi:hypothetical protein
MTTFAQAIVAELDLFADPVRRIADGPDGVQEVLGRLGWDFTSVAADDVAAIADAASAIVDAVQTLIDGTGEAADLAAILTLLDALRELAVQLDAVAEAIASIDLDPPPVLEDLAAEVMGFLFARYLREYRPVVYELARLLRLVEGPREAAPTKRVVLRGTDRTVRWPRSFERMRLDRLPALLSDPVGLLGDYYLAGGLAALRTAEDVASFVERLWRPLGDLVFALGGEPSHGVPAGVDLIADEEVMEYARSTLRLAYSFGRLGAIGVRLVPVGEHLGGPRLIISPFGAAEIAREFSGWTLYLSADTDTAPIVFWPGQVHLPSAAGVGGEILLLKNPTDSGPAFILGAPSSSRIELGAFGLGIGAELSADGDYDWGPSLFADEGKLVVDTGDADAFLAKLLGTGFEVDFDAHLRWTRNGGLRLDGSGGLTKRFAIDRAIGPISITGAELAITPSGDAVSLVAAADLAAELGPFAVTVDGTGLRMELRFPETGGNLGLLDVSLAFAPPIRVGFTIDTDVVSGGGFVSLDFDQGRYSGALSLDILSIGIDAIVVVDTQLPGDPEGWALFASLSAQFPGIPLGFGFTLLGVGGLLALNRTMDAEALAAARRSGVIDALLFPDDPVGDSAELIAQIDDYFPLREGNTVIGPVIEIGWGSPTLITAQLGIVLSLPDGIIAVMGSVEALLPIPTAPLITLHMDSLGVIDIGAGTFSLSASLYDSKLLQTIDLGGDMAMYLQVSGQPYFLLSVGGSHPGFEPPSLVPAAMHDLRRMQASITIASNVTVTVEAYFAVTSNSAQFGASVNVVASVEIWPATYTAKGWFGFDVLLVFSPFKIVASMSAGVGIYSGNNELMGVQLSLQLEGPEPWYAAGNASFKFFGLKVDFEPEVGSTAAGEPKPIAHPRADVLAALRSPASWSETDPLDGLAAGITYVAATPEDDTVWVRPDHQLTVRQSIAPLNRTLEIVGQALPAPGEELMIVTEAGFGTTVIDNPEPANDWFAPAQFEVLGRTDKLTRASFEEMNAGVTFGAPTVAIPSRNDLMTKVSTEYESEVWEPDPAADFLLQSVHTGAAGIGLRHLVAPTASPMFTIAPTAYTLVRSADGVTAVEPLGGVSQYDAMRVRNSAIAADEGEANRLVLVPVTAALEPAP